MIALDVLLLVIPSRCTGRGLAARKVPRVRSEFLMGWHAGSTAANQQVLAGSKGSEQAAGVAVNYEQAVKAQQGRATAAAVKMNPGTAAAAAADRRLTTLAATASSGGWAQTGKKAAPSAVVVPSLPSATPAAPPSSSSNTGMISSGSFGKGSQSSSNCSSSSSAEGEAGGSSAAAVGAAASSSSSYGKSNQSSSSSSAAAGPVHIWSFLEQIQVAARQQQLQQVGSTACQQFPGATPTATSCVASAAAADNDGAAHGRAAAAPAMGGCQNLPEKEKKC